MRKLIFTVMLTLLPFIAFGQEKQNNFKIGAFYTLNQFPGFDAEEIAEYVDGYQFEFRGRIAGEKTKLFGLVAVERKNDIMQLDPETYPIDPMLPVPAISVQRFDVVRRNTTSLRFGAALSHSFGAFEPFVSASAGFRASNDIQPRKLERAYQAGGDVNLNKFFIRVAYQFTRVTGNEGTEQGYVVGGGFKF